jgi:hypothetical protein
LNIAYKLLFNAQLINSTFSNRSVAMQPNKTKLALKIGAVVLGALCASNASADTFTAIVNTVDDVTITPRAGQVLDFGPNIYVTAGGICTINVDGTTDLPGGVLMNYAEATDAVAQAASFGSITGGSTLGCATTTTTANGASVGVWDVVGAPGVAVSLLISPVTQTGDYTFVPDGCFVDYDSTITDDADACTDIASNAVQTATFAAASSEDDGGGSTGSGTSVGGQFSLAVGGVLTVGTTPLNPATPYDLSFQIDVTY